MNILDFESGKKEFMTLEAFTDNTFNQRIDGCIYQVIINPDTFEKDMSASYNNDQTINKFSIASGRFRKMGTIQYSFSLMFDGTGIVNPNRKNVKEEINNLRKVLFYETSKGSGYRPNYISITYCGEIFHCIPTTFRTTYTLFHPNGAPLRAKVSCNFTSTIKKEPDSKDLDNSASKNEKKWYENFSEALSKADEGCNSLFNLLPII